MATFGGLGGLAGYDIGDILGAVGQSLLTSPRTAPLAGLPAAIQARNKQSDEEMARGATEMALTKLGIDPATAKVMSRNPQAAALWVTGDNAAKGRAMGAEAMKGFGAYTLPGEEPAAPATASPSPAAPAQKVGSLGGLGGMQPAAGGDRMAGSGAPGSALDLIMKHESGGKNVHQNVIPAGGGFNPSTGTVAGPSSASGYFQMIDPTWRKAAAMAGIDAGQYPTAMSAPYELQRKAAAALYAKEGFAPWAPYNASLRAEIEKRGGAGAFSNDDGGGLQQPMQVAGNGPAPSGPVQAGNPAAAADAQRVAREGGPRMVLSAENPAVQPGADGLPSQPYQVAGAGGKVPVPVGQPPVMPKADAPAGNKTARAQAIQVAKHAIGVLAASGWMGEAGKGVAEAAKARLDMARRWLDPTDFDRIAISAGLTPGSPEYQALARSNIDKRPEAVRTAEAAYPGQPERQRQALQAGLPDNRPEVVRLGQSWQDQEGLVDDGLKVMARQKQMEASATTAGTKTAEAQQTAPAALDRAQQALATVAKLRNHPGRYWNTGLLGVMPPVPGSSGSDFVALFNQAKSQAFTQAFDMLRGAGAITEPEGTKGTSALNRLDRGLSDAGFDEALKDYEDVIRTGMARLQKATGAQPTRSGGTVTTPFGTIRQVR